MRKEGRRLGVGGKGNIQQPTSDIQHPRPGGDGGAWCVVREEGRWRGVRRREPSNNHHPTSKASYFWAPARTVSKWGGWSSRATTLISMRLKPASSSQRWRSLSAKPGQRSP